MRLLFNKPLFFDNPTGEQNPLYRFIRVGWPCANQQNVGRNHITDDSALNQGQLLITYLKPKTFEFYRDKPIYELVGIKAYKKYLPTTGDIARRTRKITQINVGKADKKDELYRYERKTRNYEWRHLLGAIIFVMLVVMIDKKLTIFDWIFLAGLNLFVNIYPIMLQRYNRIRIIRVLQNNGHSSPYDLLAR